MSCENIKHNRRFLHSMGFYRILGLRAAVAKKAEMRYS